MAPVVPEAATGAFSLEDGVLDAVDSEEASALEGADATALSLAWVAGANATGLSLARMAGVEATGLLLAEVAIALLALAIAGVL